MESHSRRPCRDPLVGRDVLMRRLWRGLIHRQDCCAADKLEFAALPAPRAWSVEFPGHCRFC